MKAFQSIIDAFNGTGEHEATLWTHPTTGENRIKVKYQGKYAGFVVNPAMPQYEASFKKAARIELPQTPESSETLSDPSEIASEPIETRDTADRTEMALQALNSRIYLVEIDVTGSVSPIAVDWDHIGLDDELIQALKSSKAEKIRIPVFAKLTKAVNRIRNERIRIYAKYTAYAAPWRYCTLEAVDGLIEEYEVLQAECQTLKSEVIESLETEKRAYLQGILAILEKVIDDKSIQEYILSVYAEKFPTPEEIESRFSVSLSQFIEVPSLFEQVQEDTEKTRQLAENTASKALLAAKREYATRMQESLGLAVKEATRELYSLLAETLEKISSSDCTDKSRQVCRKALERCEILAQFNPNLTLLTDAFGATVGAYAKDDRQALDNALARVKIELQGHQQALDELPTDTRDNIVKWML